MAMHIPEDFSRDFCLRAIATRTGTDVTPEVINGSTVHLYMDVTSVYVVNSILIPSDHDYEV